MEPDAAQWTTATYISLGSLVLAVFSLFWNLYNTIQSGRVQKRVRASALKLSEFGNIRTPIITALQGVEERKKLIAALQKSGWSDSEVREELQPLNTDLVEAFALLEDALTSANESQFADGQDWLNGFSRQQDKALNAINKAFNPNTARADFNSALDDVSGAVREMATGIRARIEAEVARSLA